MELVLNTDALKEALVLLSSSTKRKPGMISSCILFEVRDHYVTLRASDRLVYTSLELSESNGVVKASGPDSFTIEETRISQWLANVDDEVVSFHLDAETESVVLKCGSFEAPFASQDPARFTAHTIFEAQLNNAQPQFTCLAQNLLKGIAFARRFVATQDDHNDPNRQLQTVSLREGRVLGTNSRLLGAYMDEELGDGLNIGQEQLSSVESFLKRQGSEALVEVLDTEDFFFLKCSDEVWFGSITPRSSMPVMEIPLDLTEDHMWSIEESSLKSALNALQATADPDATKVTATLTGEGDTAVWELSMQSARKGTPSVVSLIVNKTSESTESYEFAFEMPSMKQILSAFSGTMNFAASMNQPFVKIHQSFDSGATQLCLMSLPR